MLPVIAAVSRLCSRLKHILVRRINTQPADLQTWFLVSIKIKRYVALTAVFSTTLSAVTGSIFLLAVNPSTSAHDHGFLVLLIMLMVGFKIFIPVMLVAGWINDRLLRTDGENGYPYWSARRLERDGDIEMGVSTTAAARERAERSVEDSAQF